MSIPTFLSVKSEDNDADNGPLHKSTGGKISRGKEARARRAVTRIPELCRRRVETEHRAVRSCTDEIVFLRNTVRWCTTVLTRRRNPFMLSFIFRGIYGVAEINKARYSAEERRRRIRCKIQLDSTRAIIGRAVALSRTVNHPENIYVAARLLLHIEKFASCATARAETLAVRKCIAFIPPEKEKERRDSKFLKSGIFVWKPGSRLSETCV